MRPSPASPRNLGLHITQLLSLSGGRYHYVRSSRFDLRYALLMIRRKIFLTRNAGASGITGWAIVNAILNGYPGEDAFQSVIALTNRPLSTEKSQWPSSKKLQVVSGLDLLTEKGQEGLEEDMKLKIEGVDKVTHVYYFGENCHKTSWARNTDVLKAYIMDPVTSEEVSINTKLFSRAITAVEKLSSNLKFVVLPTGTKVWPTSGNRHPN